MYKGMGFSFWIILFNANFNNISGILEVSFIGGGNRSYLKVE